MDLKNNVDGKNSIFVWWWRRVWNERRLSLFPWLQTVALALSSPPFNGSGLIFYRQPDQPHQDIIIRNVNFCKRCWAAHATTLSFQHREGVKKTRIYLGLCPKHRTPPTHRARLGHSRKKKRCFFFYNLWGLKASWNGQIWPPHLCITCFRTFLDVCSKNNWMDIFTKKFGTLDLDLDPPTHSLGQSRK